MPLLYWYYSFALPTSKVQQIKNDIKQHESWDWEEQFYVTLDLNHSPISQPQTWWQGCVMHMYWPHTSYINVAFLVTAFHNKGFVVVMLQWCVLWSSTGGGALVLVLLIDGCNLGITRRFESRNQVWETYDLPMCCFDGAWSCVTDSEKADLCFCAATTYIYTIPTLSDVYTSVLFYNFTTNQ